jgi:hypothetical protein
LNNINASIADCLSSFIVTSLFSVISFPYFNKNTLFLGGGINDIFEQFVQDACKPIHRDTYRPENYGTQLSQSVLLYV